MKIALLESLGISDRLLEEYQQRLAQIGHTLVCFERTSDKNALIEQARGAQAVILANMPISPEVLSGWQDVRYIDIAFTGVDHVPIALAKARGIQISNASGYSTQAVAELTVCQMLNLLRNVKQTARRCRTGGTKAGLVGCELCGKTVGLVGCGKIGSRVAALLQAFGCQVIAYTRSRTSGFENGIRYVSLDELLKTSDIVSLHCPLNDSTYHLLGQREFSLMKKGSYLINMARGNVIDSGALLSSLDSGEIAGAALDVFEQEPPLDPSSPVLQPDKILVTPHIAFATAESMADRARIVFDNLFAWLDGKLQNPV